MSAGHDHGSDNMSDGRLLFAVVINVLLTIAQIIGGVLSGSLALIADDTPPMIWAMVNKTS